LLRDNLDENRPDRPADPDDDGSGNARRLADDIRPRDRIAAEWVAE
jgi:hypothetical protein